MSKRKPQQQSLVDGSGEAIAPLNDAASLYAELRDARMRASEDEKAAKEALIELMHKHDRTTYHNGNVSVILEPSEKVTVKISGVVAPDPPPPACGSPS